MLKGINPALSGEILHALDAMGHGDDLVLTDTNFPSDALGTKSVWGHRLTIANLDLPAVIHAVLSVLPLDTFVEHPAATMAVVDTPDQILPVHSQVEDAIRDTSGRSLTLERLERFAFYERAAASFCVIQTGERRFYGNIILRKGVIAPDES